MAQIAASSRAVLLVLPLFALAACGGGGAKAPVVGLSACSPLAQTGCGSGQKCAWFQVDSFNSIGGNGCAPVGARTAGQACVVGPDGATTGFDDCAKGLSCVAGECRTICDAATGTTCSAVQACSRYAGHFDDASGLGVCDPTCDPLTQARLTDGAAACGSPDPATPTLGCYGVASSDARPTRFLCATVPAAAQGKTHRQPALGPAGGGAFLNGCAPGYLPLLLDSTGSFTVVCIALCAPLPVYFGSTAGLGGQAPRTCAAAGATGADEECVYWWMLEDAATEVSTFSNGLGYCFDHTRYTYGDPPAPFPSCTTLAATDADANGTPDWLEFGCGPKP
jgi:hypothetical protein